MSLRDTSRDFEQAVQQYLDHIRRGGTPPFASSPAWEEAQKRSRFGDPRLQMLQLILGSSNNRGARVASNVIGAIEPTQRLLGLLLGRGGGLRWENGPDVINSPMLMRIP